VVRRLPAAPLDAQQIATTPDGDRDLMLRIALGDEEAFRGLFRRYAPIAIASARRVLGQSSLAEDSVQDAFLAIWRNAADFDERRGTVRSWLMTLVHRRAVDLVRREEVHKRRATAMQAESLVQGRDVAEAVVDALDLPEERRVIRAALNALPVDQRAVIELMYFHGLSQSQIALHLETPLGTVKSRTLLGMQKLRAALADFDR
jgi:RNA polymerase sigma factor (sigma-70 family)